MAETVKVEIPISVTDKTASGVSSAQKRLTSLEKSLQKTQRQLDKLDSTKCKVGIDAADTASNKISSIDDAVQKMNGMDATVDLGAHDGATGIINEVSDAAAALHGEESVVDLTADDAATGVISDVSDGVSTLDGTTAVIDIQVNDAASGPIGEIEERVDQLDGRSPQIDLGGGGGLSSAGSGAVEAAGGMAQNGIASTAAVMGASFGVYDSISTFAGFEAAMSQVAAISGATGEELDALTEKAKQMGATTKFTATESAEAFNYMAMAGWKTGDMMSGIEGIMNLAAASGEDLASTSDIVTDALTAFGLKASDSTHFADVLAQASSNANTNVHMMGESFKYVAPLAGAMHYSIEDTAMALGVMANAGIKSSMAGTSLRRMITTMAAPTDTAQEAMDKYGISLQDAEGNQKSLAQVMTDLRTNLGGLADDEKTAALSTMFGSEAMSGLLAIVNASEGDWEKLSSAVNNADGASQRMADTMIDNLQGSFTLMQSAIEGVEDELGGRLSPYMRDLADGIAAAMPSATKAIDKFMDKVDGMIDSDQFQGADLFGKIDIAWDTIIAEPFMTWVNGKGKTMFSQGLTKLFTSAGKIMPGGEKAGLSSWLSAGILGMGASKLVSGAGSLVEALEPVGNAIRGISDAASSAGSFGGFLSNLNDMIPMAGKVGLAAAGITAAIAGIAAAVEAYNEKQIEGNLETHFGDISLDTSQVEALSGEIVPVDITADLQLANVQFDEAEELIQKGEDALAENKYLIWKVTGVKMELSDEEKGQLVENGQEFVDSIKGAFTEQEYGAEEIVKTLLGDQSGAVVSTMQEWFTEDSADLDTLGNAITDLLQKGFNNADISEIDTQILTNDIDAKLQEALTKVGSAGEGQETSGVAKSISEMLTKAFSDGADELEIEDLNEQISEKLQGAFEMPEGQADTLAQSITEMFQTSIDSGVGNVETATALQILQDKMMEIVTGTKLSTLKGQLDMLSFRSSGAALDSESWTAVIEEAGGYQEELLSAEEESYANLLGKIENYVGNDESRRPEADAMIEMIKGAYGQLRTSSQTTVADFAIESLNDAYGEELSTARENLGSSANEWIGSMLEQMQQIESGGLSSTDAFNSLETLFANVGGGLDKSTRGALLDRFQTMLPAVDELRKAIDESTGPVPQAVMDSYTQALEIGAAGGDKGAVAGIMAQQIAEQFNDRGSFEQALEDANLNVDMLSSILGETFSDELNRAFAETTELDSSGLIAGLSEAFSGTDVDWEAVESILNEYGLSIKEALEEQGIMIEDGEIPVNADNVTVDPSTLNLKEIEGLEAVTTEHVDGELYVDYKVQPGNTLSEIAYENGLSLDQILADNPEITNPDVIDVDQIIRIRASSVEMDESSITTAIEGAGTGEGSTTPEVPVEVNGKAELNEMDTATFESDVDKEVKDTFTEPIEADGDVDVDLSQTNNAGEIYNEAAGQVQNAFDAVIPVTATANITVDYNLLNPTATVSATANGSHVTATVSGGHYAFGGRVDEPQFLVGEDGPEYVIPVGEAKRGRGVDLWMQAGNELGVLDTAEAFADGGIIGGDEESLVQNPFEKAAGSPRRALEGLFVPQTGDNMSEEKKAAPAPVNTTQSTSSSNENSVKVEINMNPVFQIDGGNLDEDEIFDVIKGRIREVADDIGAEVGESLAKIFQNMPLAAGA